MFAKGFGSLHLPVLSKVLFVTKTPLTPFLCRWLRNSCRVGFSYEFL